jgi:hypothetical protein
MTAGRWWSLAAGASALVVAALGIQLGFDLWQNRDAVGESTEIVGALVITVPLLLLWAGASVGLARRKVWATYLVIGTGLITLLLLVAPALAPSEVTIYDRSPLQVVLTWLAPVASLVALIAGAVAGRLRGPDATTRR